MSLFSRSAAASFVMLSSVHGMEYVAINATNILADASRKPIGINMDYLMDSDRRRPDAPRSTEAALREMGVRYLRYPGGEKSDTSLVRSAMDRAEADARPHRPRRMAG